jgi:hypothetical protein
MYCSTCGSLVPAGRRACDTCGAVVRQSALPAGNGSTALAEGRGWSVVSRVHLCPRCGYNGEGIGYFSRGSRLAALVGVTVLTMGAMGAGGLVYYLVRRDHLVCPRCGYRWGKNGERAAVRRGTATAIDGPGAPALRESPKRAWAVLLFVFAVLMMLGGLLGGEIGVVAASLLAAGGGAVLMQAANRDRDRRREALIASLQLPVLKLAAQQGGRLTVTEVSAHLGWPLRRAEKILQSLDDGVRVDSEVTDEGVIVYEFRELTAGQPPADDRRLNEGGAA